MLSVLRCLCVLFGAAGNVAGGRLQQAGYPAKATTLGSVTLATAALVPALPWLLSGVAWGQATAWAWGGVTYLALGVTIVGYGLWYWALGKGGIARIGLLQFLQPVSGVLLLGEPVSASLPAATALILLGVWIATRVRPPSRDLQRQEPGISPRPDFHAQARRRPL